jgi:coenzyme F420-0:L-glutamate ligase/coenzyme F420-1:gamma-L-glutamate ligase
MGRNGFSVAPLDGIPEIRAGDDLAALLAEALAPHALRDDDIITIAHKVVSKAEGRVRRLDEVEPGERARALAAEHEKDPRHVQVVLDESRRLVRADHGVLICETHHGLKCANAGVDASNVREGELVLLPVDPDGSARGLRARLGELTGARPAVVVTDSFGRPWRLGQTDVALGCAGLRPLDDWRGRHDSRGRELRATWIAVADAIAGAADLARSKDGGQPAVLVRGLGRHVTPEDGPGAAALIRPPDEDLFR